jgi:hypothetical protein
MLMTDEPTVYVRVTATARVRYSRHLNMPKSAFEEYERNCDNGTRDKWFSEFAEHWLMGDENAYDWDDYDDVEASLVVRKEVKSKG